MSSAAYQREYRKRQRRERIMNTTMPAQVVRELIEAQDRIRVLEAYIKRVCLHPAHAQPDSTPETCAHGVPIAKRRFCGPCNALTPDSTGA